MVGCRREGGLAAATVLACTALAAMVGVVGATEVTMGMIALPAMLKRGYDEKLACGSLLAGGTLGILIPPSVMAIVYAVVAQTITRRIAGRLDIPRAFVIGPVCYLHSCALLHQPEARARTAARGASQQPRKIAPPEQYNRADSVNHPSARYNLRRYRDSGGGGRYVRKRRVWGI